MFVSLMSDLISVEFFFSGVNKYPGERCSERSVNMGTQMVIDFILNAIDADFMVRHSLVLYSIRRILFVSEVDGGRPSS